MGLSKGKHHLGRKRQERLRNKSRAVKASDKAGGRRTFMYKLRDDYGGAPCAPRPIGNESPLLTLGICKPQIRASAQPGDRILGIVGKILARSCQHQENGVVYAATVDRVLSAKEYYTQGYADRLDCIYIFSESTGRFERRGNTTMHPCAQDLEHDLGKFPEYKKGKVLLCSDFRYFGMTTPGIPSSCSVLQKTAAGMGRFYRVFSEVGSVWPEVDALFGHLWQATSEYTPRRLVSGKRTCHKKQRSSY